MEISGTLDRNKSNRPIKILAGRLIDGTGEPSRHNILMTIKAGRITGMRPAFMSEIAEDDLGYDLSDCTVLPTLVDVHVHLALSGHIRPVSHVDDTLLKNKPANTLIYHNIQRCIQHGVMGVRDGGDRAGQVLQWKLSSSELKRSCFRLNAAGNAWHREGRYGKLIGRAVADGEDPVSVIEAGTHPITGHIKLIQSGLNSLEHFGRETPPQFDVDTIRRIFEYAQSRGIGLMVHANGKKPVAEAIGGGCDSIEHGYFMGNENLGKLAASGITWVPTVVPMKAYVDNSPEGSIEYEVAQRTLDHQLAQLSKARQYGVTVALGTDSGSPGVEHGKAVLQELKLLVSAGYTMEEAIRCATLNAAHLMKDDAAGYLGIGTPATFLVLKGADSNVLERLGEIEGRVVDGEFVEAESALSS